MEKLEVGDIVQVGDDETDKAVVRGFSDTYRDIEDKPLVEISDRELISQSFLTKVEGSEKEK